MSSVLLPPAAADLDHAVQGVSEHWQQLRGQKLFITGGTGFVGKWLLASLIEADRRLQLGCSVTVLTRDPVRFRAQAPFLADAARVRLIAGDVRDFAFPDEAFTHVIHAATDVEVQNDPLTVFDTCVSGTRRVLDCAKKSGAKKMLFVSSGAVYGRQPPDLMQTPETYVGAPDLMAPGSAYGEGKRAAEWLACAHGSQHGIETTVARLFAFVGPYLPLDKHFAIGNFIRDAMAGRPIEIQGDGTPFRSYLYAADMAVWLWTLLLQGKPGTAYNVGGDEAVSIAQLAQRVVKVLRVASEIRVARRAPENHPAERYVPDTTRAKTTLGLRQKIQLDEAIARTAAWHRQARTRL